MKEPKQPKRPCGTKNIALVVVAILGVISIAALGSSVHLIALIIRIPEKDGTLIAVYVGLVGQIIALAASATTVMGALLANVDRGRGQGVPPLNPDGTLPVARKGGSPVPTTDATPAAPAASADED